MSTSTTMHTPAVSSHARGTLVQIAAASATKPAFIVLALPGSNYQLHLRPTCAIESLAPRLNKPISGTITVQARRVDIARTGGRFIEPLVGRPRRVQGTVLARDTSANTLTLSAAGASAVDGPDLPVVLKITDPRQRAEHFELGLLVGCDVLDGGTIDVQG